MDPARTGDFLYQNFVYFAYRYIYRDGETTPLSPFSAAAFFPGSFRLQRDPATLLSMVNRHSAIDITYDVGGEEVVEIELVVTSSRDITVKSLATINKAERNIVSSSPYNTVLETFRYDNNKVYSTLPARELLRVYDDVPLTAKAQEFAGNRLIYGNYTQNYNLKQSSEAGEVIVPRFKVGFQNIPHSADTLEPSCAVKTDRDYQIVVVYLDFDGRQTPVLLSQEIVDASGDVISTSTVHIPFEHHQDRNVLTVNMQSPAPYWATGYRFFIKQTQGDYYNVYPKGAVRDTFNRRIYLRLDPSEVNKISSDTRFVVKGTGQGIQTIRRIFRVDPYLQQADSNAGFLITRNTDGTIELSNEPATIFDVPFDVANANTGDAFLADPTTTTEASVRSDYYIAIVPENENDLNLTDNQVVFNAVGDVDDGVILETVPRVDTVADIYFEHGQTFVCVNGSHTDETVGLAQVSNRQQDIHTEGDAIAGVNAGDPVAGRNGMIPITLSSYFNTFSYPTGVEENRILGSFNEVALRPGIKASTTNEAYRRRNQESWIIHSGLFDEDINLNRINEFSVAEAISTELEQNDGSVQLLHARNTNLIAFQEDKVKLVPINKNLIQTAGGGTTLTTDSQFFGTTNAFNGEYGISTNPESFCTYGNRMY